jgi:hypothetical protein
VTSEKIEQNLDYIASDLEIGIVLDMLFERQLITIDEHDGVQGKVTKPEKKTTKIANSNRKHTNITNGNSNPTNITVIVTVTLQI